MANVAEVIDRNATGIHPNLSIMERYELLFFTCHGVVDANWHKFTLDCRLQISHGRLKNQKSEVPNLKFEI
jgi:predicted transcriptional regulator